MLLAWHPHPYIFLSVIPAHDTHAFRFVVHPISFIFGAIRVVEDTLPLGLVLNKLPLVDPSSCKLELSLPMATVVRPPSCVYAAVSPSLSPLTLSFPLQPLACICWHALEFYLVEAHGRMESHRELYHFVIILGQALVKHVGLWAHVFSCVRSLRKIFFRIIIFRFTADGYFALAITVLLRAIFIGPLRHFDERQFLGLLFGSWETIIALRLSLSS